MAQLHFFHNVVIELQKELQRHPDLAKSLQKQAHTFEEVLGMIGVYVNVALDGDYNAVDLMDMLLRQLQKKRMPLLFEQQAPDNLIGVSAILGADGKLMPKAGIQVTKEQEYDLQKTLHLEIPPEKKNGN